MEAISCESSHADWLQKLSSIQADIPDYADWRISDLIDCFLRYHDLLLTLADDVQYREGCADLLRHSGFIQKCILETRNANPWAPFTRAAYELHRDIDQLKAAILDALTAPLPETEALALPV